MNVTSICTPAARMLHFLLLPLSARITLRGRESIGPGGGIADFFNRSLLSPFRVSSTVGTIDGDHARGALVRRCFIVRTRIIRSSINLAILHALDGSHHRSARNNEDGTVWMLGVAYGYPPVWQHP